MRICTSIHMPILSDSSRGPTGNTERKLTQESPILRCDVKRFDESFGLQVEFKRHLAVRKTCQPHRKKPTWTDDCDSACAIGTKATCAALCKEQCTAAPSARLTRIATAWLFTIRSEAATASMILTSRSSATLKTSIIQIQEPLRSRLMMHRVTSCITRRSPRTSAGDTLLRAFLVDLGLAQPIAEWSPTFTKNRHDHLESRVIEACCNSPQV